MTSYSFTVRVTDSLGAIATRPQAVEIGGSSVIADSLLAKLIAWYDFDSANPHRDDWGVYELGGGIGTVAGKIGNAAPAGLSRKSVIGIPQVGAAGVSVGAWMKFSTTASLQSFGIGQNSSAGELVSIGVGATGKHSVISFSSAGTSYGYDGNAAAAGTYKLLQASVIPSGQLTLHVNTVVEGTPTTVGASLRPSNVIAIGDMAGAVSKADLDTAYVARGVLSSDERALIYNGGAGRTLADIIALSTVTIPACNLGGLTIDRAKYAVNYLRNRIGRHNGTGHTLVRTTTGHGAGKRWFAVRYDLVGNLGSDIIGLVNASAATTYPGADTNGLGVQFSRSLGVGRYNGGSFVSTPVFSPVAASGDIVMIAWDAASRKVWIGKNGTWSGDPAAGTGELFTFGAAQTLFVAMSDDAASAKNLAFLMRSDDVPYASPSGFSPWGD